MFLESQIVKPDRGELFIGDLAFCLVVVFGLSIAVAPTWAGEAERYINEGSYHLHHNSGQK